MGSAPGSASGSVVVSESGSGSGWGVGETADEVRMGVCAWERGVMSTTLVRGVVAVWCSGMESRFESVGVDVDDDGAVESAPEGMGVATAVGSVPEVVGVVTAVEAASRRWSTDAPITRAIADIQP